MKAFIVIFLLISNTVAVASEQCLNLFQLHAGRSVTTNDNATWRYLRATGLLVNQQSIPGKKDLCTVACAVNVLQAAAVKAGLAPLQKPQAVFERFVRDQVITEGADIGITVTRLKMLFHTRFKDRSPTVTATFIRGLNQDIRTAKEVTSMTLEDLKSEGNRLKLIITAQLDANDQIVMLHAQIIESIVGNEVRLVEPNAPELDIVADVRGTLVVNDIPIPHFYYRGTELTGLKSFIPVGVITIEVDASAQ